jgi:F420-dependent oxidoreductase-like protein
MRVCLMIEGQENVTWADWTALARACEQSGIEALFRSDHYLSVRGRLDQGSLDAWTTLAGLAALTERLRLGTLVSPTSFRHPSVLAKSVATVDHISNGRVELGMGAGWLEAEHAAYGFAFGDARTRMEGLAEQLEIVHRQWTEESFRFEGRHYRLEDLDALPKPVQQPHPPLILGGSGGEVSARLAARWADEYNTVFAGPAECAARRERVLQAFEAEGRDPSELRFSVMTACVVGVDRADFERRARAAMTRRGKAGDLSSWIEGLGEAWVIGTVDEVVDKLRALGAAGVDRVMLQHQDHEDVEMVELLGRAVAPKVA